jgi:orotate phosphoribosyltransferase-like protein
MKIVEDYAQRIAQKKVDENNEKTIINLNKKGFKSEEIAETIEVSIDFVNKVLANEKNKKTQSSFLILSKAF